VENTIKCLARKRNIGLLQKETGQTIGGQTFLVPWKTRKGGPTFGGERRGSRCALGARDAIKPEPENTIEGKRETFSSIEVERLDRI